MGAGILSSRHFEMRRHRRSTLGTRCATVGALMKRVFLVTYGCQMNVADSELMAAVLERRGASVPVAELRLDGDETYGDLEPRRGAGVRAWVTVQRGCDKFCTYCVVPYTRGRERSLPIAELLGQVERAAAQGFREIVFLGQTVNSYHDGAHDFADLLRATAAVPGVLRTRYTSPHPADMSERVIAAMTECEKVMPHVHLPLQSGSDRVLAAMQRSYTLAQYQ